MVFCGINYSRPPVSPLPWLFIGRLRSVSFPKTMGNGLLFSLRLSLSTFPFTTRFWRAVLEHSSYYWYFKCIFRLAFSVSTLQVSSPTCSVWPQSLPLRWQYVQWSPHLRLAPPLSQNCISWFSLCLFLVYSIHSPSITWLFLFSTCKEIMKRPLHFPRL